MTSIAASVSALRALKWSNTSGVPGLISGGEIEAPVITALTAGPTESVPDSKGDSLWTASSSFAAYFLASGRSFLVALSSITGRASFCVPHPRATTLPEFEVTVVTVRSGTHTVRVEAAHAAAARSVIQSDCDANQCHCPPDWCTDNVDSDVTNVTLVGLARRHAA